MSSYAIFRTTDAIDGTGAPGQAVSATTTYYSELISGKQADGLGVEFRWTGDPTGTLSFWVSDKPDPSVADDTDWVQDSTNYTAVNPAGSASKSQHSISSRHAWKRFKYINSSGSGVLLGFVNVSRTA